jgi:hypothetical protein
MRKESSRPRYGQALGSSRRPSELWKGSQMYHDGSGVELSELLMLTETILHVDMLNAFM